jgi:murein DD-endopeptidase MepM/ murein hydrolase activator NlpD
MRIPSTPPAPGRLPRFLAVAPVLLLTLVALAVGTPAYADQWAPSDGVWPLDPRPAVVAGFDPPSTRWGAGHRGVDLAGRPGQPVRAAAPGRVSFAGRLAGRGVVVVDHGGTRSTYEPVSASVSVGDPVSAGAVLGRLEVFGSHCFPRSCLHWGLIEGSEHYLDPLTLVGAGPVRLLPLDGSLPLALLGSSVPEPPGPRGTAALVRGSPPG